MNVLTPSVPLWSQVRARGKNEEERRKEEAAMDPQILELRRKRSNWRTKKKIKLLEKFPSYIQEAFFGRNLMDTSNLEEEMKQFSDLDTEAEEDISMETNIAKASASINLSKVNTCPPMVDNTLSRTCFYHL